MKGNDKKMIWRRWRRDLEEEHLDLQPAFKEHTRERRRRCASGSSAVSLFRTIGDSLGIGTESMGATWDPLLLTFWGSEKPTWDI